MKMFLSKLFYYSMYQCITKVLPTFFVYYTQKNRGCLNLLDSLFVFGLKNFLKF